ncbi:MAG: hypothetical protein LQ341_005858, partial [Variospora aurantia]
MSKQYRRYIPYVRSATWPQDVVQLRKAFCVLEQTQPQLSRVSTVVVENQTDTLNGPAETPSLAACSDSSPLFHCCVPLPSGSLCSQTLACTTHQVEAKKAVAARKVSDYAWFRLQNPDLDVRISREARRAKKADERRKAETSQGSSKTKMGCTTSPAPEGSSLQAQSSIDPVGVMLALLVYWLLIAFAVGVESLRRILAKGDAWVTARLECPRVRQEKAVSVSRRESRSRRTTDVAQNPTISRNIVEDVPSTNKQVQLAASREIVDAEILAVQVTAYRRELTAPREVIDAKQIANEVEAYRRKRHQELREDLDEHLHNAAVITAQQIGGNQDGLWGPLLDDVDPLMGLRMSEEEKKKKERILESV